MSADPKNRWHLRRFLFVGYVALFLLVGGLGGWAAVTRIAGAVIAPGALEVEGNRQVIQHPTGGVIEEINARDGDEVTEGDVIIRLDGQSLVSELGIVEGQWFEILARKSRLSAERDGLAEIDFDPELVSRAADSPEIAKLMTAQSQQFEARRKLQAEERQQLQERQTQISRQIDGLDALQSATQSQIDLLSKEISGQEELLRQGLTQVTRVLTPQRELARLRGTDGQVEATIAENRGKIAEIEIERVRLDSEMREEAISELRDLEFREIELRERRRDLLDRIEKLDLRAPVSGIVYGSTADTLRGVIRPAEPVMYIVPKDIPLIVRSRIEPIHIDQVYVGQEATLRFSAFDARTTPEVTGHVKSISADTYEDPNLRQRYYKA
ncbi:MAG TPA: HlyD family type I secretion periplasmic adaptor subunit, partial [Amaricoccus sp.]|nr:HlyD family type I secretion periplasmic adaptor subunit [Amaricoccus sp.]